MSAPKIINLNLYKNILSAVKKLTPEEKQLLQLQLFGKDALSEMKSFEIELKKKKPVIKRMMLKS